MEPWKAVDAHIGGDRGTIWSRGESVFRIPVITIRSTLMRSRIRIPESGSASNINKSDPDFHPSQTSAPDPHQSKKADQDPH
jgi:hypothetical protein